ncbi:hypothetical protein C7974DRAFT_449539 [Boeremia exigua]|uniref:uncharacterized protein n=1 Tax=Boeremia exigua TaxID=749465 RepID=UPI001E8E9CF1|nr:uncharacterized protein C7974DRAFT_449539 [Boeremia exigua]KAH6639435.1 hypothetical protein C7974DRAFT_449539 [Boeremia exigua]
MQTPGAVDDLISLYKQPGREALKPDALDWPEGECIMDDYSLGDKIRMAHAIERLIQLSKLTPTTWLTSTTSNMADWVPHLLALHHPASWCLEPDMFLLPHGQLSQSNTTSTSSLLVNRWLSRTNDQARDRVAFAKLQMVHFTNISFILNYTTLQRLGSTKKKEDILVKFVRHFVADSSNDDDSRLSTVVGTHDMAVVVIKRLSERIPGYGTFNRSFDLTQASAALSLLLVAVAFEYGNQLIPTPAHIPFTRFMDIPSVYHRSAELFSTCHYRCMTTPEFLSGQWHGFYTDHRLFVNRAIYVDRPMQDIRMVTEEPTEEARTRLRINTVIARETRGYDSHGDFRLSGRVREDGLVSVAKQYLGHGFSWTWTGRITPFGIVGVWGNNSFGGYFWIFKAEWMASHVISRE